MGGACERKRAIVAAIVAAGVASARAEVPAPDPAPSPDGPAARAEVPEQVVVVTGTRTPRRIADDPVGTERIGARELAARNVRDASRALEAEPGIQVERSFRGASFQLRGLDAKYVRVLVDGQPVMGQVNDVIDLRRYAIESIDRIEVVRGATSALYGSDALAGVVNLISRRPRRALELGGFAQYGQLNTSMLGLTAGTRRGEWAASVGLNWFGNDSYDLTPGDENLSTNGDARRAGTITARGFWLPSERLEAMAYVRGGLFDSRGVDLQPPRALYNRRVGEREGSAGAQAEWKPDDATRIVAYAQANAFARSFWRQQRQGPGRDDQESLETLARVEVQGDRALRDGLSITTGLGGQRAAFDSPRLAEGGARVWSGWAFAQLEASLLDLVDVVGGARADLDGEFGAHASPRAAVRVRLGRIAEGLSLRAAYGEGFRAPSFGERHFLFHNQVANYVVYGNPALRPEVSRGAQAGLEWAPREVRALGSVLPSLRVTAFRNRLTGLVQARETEDSSEVMQRFQYVNYSTARLVGVEASARVTAGSWLIADLGYAWLDARATFDGEERFLPGRAARQATAGVVLQHARTGTELTVKSQLLLRRTALDDDVLLPDALIADVRLARRVWRDRSSPAELQLYVAGDNLADVTDAAFLALPGRTFALGVNARY